VSSIADPSVDEAAIGAINDAAGYCRTLWVTFIGYAATIFVLTSGTTHEALLRRTPVKLPLFNVDSGIPLLLFYVIAPLLLVLFHLNLLLKLHDLRVRVSELILPLNYCDDANAQFERNRLRRRLMAFDYAMLKAGLVTERRERWLLSLVTDTTIFIMPVLLLLFVQLQFLPYHDWKVSWLQRGFVIADLGLIAYIQLWLGKKREEPGPRAVSLKPRDLAMGAAFVFPVLASVFVLAFPGEPQDVLWRIVSPAPHSALAGADFAERFGIRRSLYLADRTLWATDPPEDVLQALNEDATIIALHDSVGADAKTVRLVQRIRSAALNLRGRNLSHANFENSRLIAADLSPNLNNEQMRAFERQRTGDEAPDNTTDVQGASFSGADLRGAKLGFVEADDGYFYAANLQSCILVNAHLRGANFSNAMMQEADLAGVQLQSAVLNGAQLQGASLIQAEMRGAHFNGAAMQGMNLVQVGLEGADFTDANLQGAQFNEARATGAVFTDARLEGVDFAEARLQGARLNRARLRGANFQGAGLQGADLSLARLEGANFSGAQLQGADLAEARLRGADLTKAAIKGTSFANADVSFVNLSGASVTADYDFRSVREAGATIEDPEIRKAFLARAAGAEERTTANAPPLKDASGDTVLIADAGLAGAEINRTGAPTPERYAPAWTESVAELSCEDPNSDEDPATAAISRNAIAARLSERAKALDMERDRTLRMFGVTLAAALLNHPCAKVNLTSERSDELEEIAHRTLPAQARE
jgi:uncharacterized protein YjbI with pentapeptide repeats